MIPTNKKPVGRPPGPVDPDKLHAQEITRWVQVNKRIRELTETQLTYFENIIKLGDTNLEGHLDILKGLGDMLTISSRVIESGLKALDKGNSRGDTNEDIEDVLEGIHGGKGG